MMENQNREHVFGRADVLIDRATRIVRLLAWTAMFALCCLMLWTLGGMAAHAEDPKAAARAIGQAGTAAAGAIGARRLEGRHGSGLCRDGRGGAESDGLGHGRRRPRASLPIRTIPAAKPAVR